MAFRSAHFTRSSFALLGCALLSSALTAQAPASFKGRVLMDTLIQPIADAEIVFPHLSRSVKSDSKGGFRFDSIAPGIHRVQVRKIGYGLFDAQIRFDEGETVERAVLLPRLTNLNAVVVVGESFLPLSFLEHRAAGLGRFVTRADLERQGNRRLSDILSQISGVGVQTGRSNQGWVLSKRYTAPIRFSGMAEDPCKPSPYSDPNAMRGSKGADMYFPDCAEKSSGMRPGCFARVYLDRVLLNSSTPAEPVNVNEYMAHNLEAIEYFGSASQVPVEYSRLNSNCGVLVLHRRKSP